MRSIGLLINSMSPAQVMSFSFDLAFPISCAGPTGPLISVNNPWRQVELRYQRQRAIWCVYGYDNP